MKSLIAAYHRIVRALEAAHKPAYDDESTAFTDQFERELIRRETSAPTF